LQLPVQHQLHFHHSTALRGQLALQADVMLKLHFSPRLENVEMDSGGMD
jgi:hypothetical protein